MMDLLNKKAVLIDMDGTIVDSHPVLKEVYHDFMHQIGVEGSEEEFLELVGPSMTELITILRDRYGVNLSVEELVGKYHQSLENVYTSKLRLFNGVLEFLSYVRSKGIKVALVTSASHHLACNFIESQGIIGYFDSVVTPTQGKGKPAPDIYLKALNELSCEARDAVVIEDSPNGVQAAVNAGIETLHIFHAPLPRNLMESPLVAHVNDWYEVIKGCGETHGGI